MIELQLLSGMRPGEVCIMRAKDLETSGDVWIYRPEKHKEENRGHAREIYLGPKAQAVVKKFLKPSTEAYLFSPADAEDARHAERRSSRKTPLYPSHVRRQKKKRKRNPARPPGDRYDVDSYRRAIARACKKAFPLPDHLSPRTWGDGKRESGRAWWKRLTAQERAAVQAWRRNHRFHPHQCRHNAGTALRKEFGIEVARIILGHQEMNTTEIYAEVDRQQAMEVISKIG
jgi:integrase